jgi:hypothetical protein
MMEKKKKNYLSIQREGKLWTYIPVGADEANGGGKPPASCPSPPASKTKEATGPNP